jgi:hypothetical protein
MLNKTEIITKVINVLNEKVNNLQNQLLDIGESLKNETKSTVGDKYETARAMLHAEQKNIQALLNQNKNLHTKVTSIIYINTFSKVHEGCVIETDKGIFFLAIGLGRITINSEIVFVISALSPLGKLFLNKTKMDKVTMKNVTYQILNFY